MIRTVKKIKGTLLAALAVGIIGFAAYGGYNVSRSLTDLGQDDVAGSNAVLANVADSVSVSPDGSICSPYGCAGCGGCTNPQYQAAVTAVYDNAVESGLVAE